MSRRPSRPFWHLGKWSRRILVAYCGILLGTGLLLASPAYRSGYWDFRALIPDLAELRRHRIEREIGALGPDHPWAGVYAASWGYGGDTIFIAPRSGWYENLSSDANFGWPDHWGGSLRVKENTFFLRYHGGLGRTEEYHLVHWQGQRYLLRRDQLEQFANDVNSGSVNGYLISDRDEFNLMPGRPDLPDPYRKLLRDTPLDAQVTAVGSRIPVDEFGWNRFPSDGMQTTVILDIGSSQGALVGLVLKTEAENIDGEVRITSVSHDSSVGLFQSSLGGTNGLRKGLRLTTRREEMRGWSPFEPRMRIRSTSLTPLLLPRLSGRPKRIANSAYVAAAKRAGLRVEPVARIILEAVDAGLLPADEPGTILSKQLNDLGANAYLDTEGFGHQPPIGPGKKVLTAYRFEWKGKPLSWDDFWNSDDWRVFKMQMAINDLRYYQKWQAMRDRTIEGSLHMSYADYEQLKEKRIEYLTPEQREALRTELGIEQEFGHLNGPTLRADDAWWSKIHEALRPEVEKLDASDPKGRAEYKRLSDSISTIQIAEMERFERKVRAELHR